MTWEHISRIAVRVCTEKQLDVLRLWAIGLGTTRIALALGISRSTARDHLLRAQQKIKIEIEREGVIVRTLDLENAEVDVSALVDDPNMEISWNA